MKTQETDNKILITQFSSGLFWDVDISDVSIMNYPSFVVERVLSHGKLDDWRLIVKIYGLPRIAELCMQLRTMNPVDLAFVSAVTHTDKTAYRCYNTAQSFPTLWNS